MTRAEFTIQAKSLGVLPDAYDLDQMRNESYILARDDVGYKVFYSERGFERGVEQFSNESDALEHLIKLLIQDPTTRAR